MSASNFNQQTLAGENTQFAEKVAELHNAYGFDFVAIGLTAFAGAPLKWIYSAGATSDRFRRITLAPGHGIGGIVIKSGSPMMLLDIDSEMDPREYSSFPIVFAEDLRSFCALPLQRDGRTVAVLLCAYRSASVSHEHAYEAMIDALGGTCCGLDVINTTAMDFATAVEGEADLEGEEFLALDAISMLVKAQENERRRISRDIHDGVAQEVLAVSFVLQHLQMAQNQAEANELLAQAKSAIDSILAELHNISVELRPSTLDYFGLVSALRSQAKLYAENFGCTIVFETLSEIPRFNQAQETQVYRICQEAVLNACKYSGSEKIVVRMEMVASVLHVEIVDTGCGFNVEKPTIKGSGVGLGSMRERASMISATLEFSSSAQGTTVSLTVPVFTAEA